jgi:hypothetical protein
VLSEYGRRERPSRAAPGPWSTTGRLHVRAIPPDLNQQVDNEHPPLSEHGETNTLKRVRFPRPIVLGGRRVMTAGRRRKRRLHDRTALPQSNPVPNHSLRRSLHGSGRSAPSRGKPLTARLVGRCAESVAERTPAQGRLISLHLSSVCLHVSSARIAVPITTGESLRAQRDRTATVWRNIRDDCVASVSTLAAVASSTFLLPTGRSRSIRTSGGRGAKAPRPLESIIP